MYKNDFTPTGEYQIRIAGEVTYVQPIPESHPMDEPPDHVFRTNSAHPLAGGRVSMATTFADQCTTYRLEASILEMIDCSAAVNSELSFGR